MGKRRKSGISLPWEYRGSRVLSVLSLRRWRSVLGVLLLTVLAFFFWKRSENFEDLRRTRIVIQDAKSAVLSFREDFGRCPRFSRELLNPPRMREPYLRAAPRDAWGRKLFIRCPGYFDKNEVDVVSAGPSGSFFVDDNVR